MATYINDKKILPYIEKWLIQLKGKQKDEHSNLSSNEDKKLDEDSARANVIAMDIL